MRCEISGAIVGQTYARSGPASQVNAALGEERTVSLIQSKIANPEVLKNCPYEQ